MTFHIEQLDDTFHFRATNEAGLSIEMDDATAREDGQGKGVGPMQMLAMALGGCSGIDIVSILRKGRQPLEKLEMEVEGERAQGQVPSLYTSLHVHYKLTGDLDPDKVRRAIDLSLDTYCSVAKTLEPTASITYDFSINGTRHEGSRD